MQFFGTEVLQMEIQKVVPGIGRTFFAERLSAEIAKSDPAAKLVVSDLRFAHELRVLRRDFPNQVVVVRVHRPSLETTDDGNNHVSEHEFKTLDVDWEIENGGSIEAFEREITELLSF